MRTMLAAIVALAAVILGVDASSPAAAGDQFSIPDTRAVIAAVQSGSLKSVPTEHLPGINLQIPRAVPGVDSAVLNPRSTWADPAQYDRKAAELVDQFQRNFMKFKVSEAIVAAGPQGHRAEGAV